MLDEIRSIFDIYDDDKSGTLDEEEFVYAMSRTGGYSEEYADQMFREIDTDGSGQVTFDEFRLWYVNNAMKQARIMRDAEKDSDEEL
jgi:Ca2+-binding EF-hand superfamily protein